MVFITDFDHPVGCFQTDHPKFAIPFCVKRYHFTDGNENIIAGRGSNYLIRNEIFLDDPVQVNRENIELVDMNGSTPAAMFSVLIYST